MNESLSDLFHPLLIASRDAALMALAVGGVLALARHRIPAAWRHALWLLVAVRLALPVLPSSPLSWQRLLPSEAQGKGAEHGLVEAPLPEGALPAQSGHAVEPIPSPGVSGSHNEVPESNKTEVLSSPAVPETLGAGRVPWMALVLGLWLMGTGGILILGAGLTWRFRGRLKRFTHRNHPRQGEVEALLWELCQDLGIRRPPRPRLTEAVSAPALTGLFRPEILVPPAVLDRLDASGLRLVLLHELGHLRRADLWVNLGLSLLQAIHWFNPLVWWAFHRTRLESERATDAWVLRRAGEDGPSGYGETLLCLLEQVSKPKAATHAGVVSVLENPRDLHRRLAAIGRFTHRRNRLAVAVSGILILGLATVGLTQAPKQTGDPKAGATVSAASPDGEVLECIVKSADGNPVPEAEVFFYQYRQAGPGKDESVQPLGTTGKDGVIRVPVLPEWKENKWRLGVIAVRHPEAGYGIATASQMPPEPLEIGLERGLPLSFRVTGPKGDPVPELTLFVRSVQTPVLKSGKMDKGGFPRVWVEDLPDLPAGFWNATTDENGYCQIQGLPEGLYYVDHKDARFAQVPGQHAASFQHKPEAGGKEVNLQLMPASKIQGTVRLPDGTPVPNAFVKALEDYSYQMGGSAAEELTDENGHYELGRLLPSNYDLSVTLTGELEKDWVGIVRTEVQLAEGETLNHQDIAVVKGGLVTGKVTLSDTGEGAAGFDLGGTSVHATSPLHQWWSTTEADGTYRFRLPPGKRKVYPGGLPPEGYSRTSSDTGQQETVLDLKEGGTYGADFTLYREMEIQGVVVDAAGNPVPDATVTCPDIHNSFRQRDVITDEDGKFSLNLLPGTSRVQLIASHGDQLSQGGQWFELGEEARLELMAAPFAKATGQVVDEAGQPIEGARVAWTSETIRDIPTETFTDAGGHFQAEKILPGERIGFWASKDGYGENVEQADLIAGQTAEVPLITLLTADASLAGRVVDLSGSPVAGALVTVDGYLQPSEVETFADENGFFELKGVVPGWLWVRAANPRTGSARFVKVRARTGSRDVVAVLPDEPYEWHEEKITDHTGKPAPPLKVDTWFNTDGPLPAAQPGKVRFLCFVGLDRPLIFFSNTLPALQKIREDFPSDELEIIAVHGSWPREEVAEILKSDYPDFALPLGIESVDSPMSEAFGIQYWLNVVIDREGKVAYQNRRGWKKVRETLAELLGVEAKEEGEKADN